MQRKQYLSVNIYYDVVASVRHFAAVLCSVKSNLLCVQDNDIFLELNPLGSIEAGSATRRLSVLSHCHTEYL